MKKENISEDFQKIFINKELKYPFKESGLLRANEVYNSLIKRGVIKKRGYTLRGIEDTHLFYAKLNGY